MNSVKLGATCLIGTLLSFPLSLAAYAEPLKEQDPIASFPSLTSCIDEQDCTLQALDQFPVLYEEELFEPVKSDVDSSESQLISTGFSFQSKLVADLTELSPEVVSDSVGSRPRLKRTPESENDPLYRPRSDILLERSGQYGPSITLLTPSAFGKDWRQFSVGVGFQERTRFTTSSDGAVGVGFGLGDSEKYVGLDIGITFTDLSDFFDRGIVSFKLHRRLKSDLAIAAGVNDALSWGNGDVDGPSPYGVVSKIFVLDNDTNKFFSQVAVSAGVGTGRYRSEFDIFNNNDDPNPFGSVAMRLFDPVNLITEWSGQDLSIGLSLRPIKKIPVVITPAFTDLTGNAGDGGRFILGVGYSTRF